MKSLSIAMVVLASVVMAAPAVAQQSDIHHPSDEGMAQPAQGSSAAQGQAAPKGKTAAGQNPPAPGPMGGMMGGGPMMGGSGMMGSGMMGGGGMGMMPGMCGMMMGMPMMGMGGPGAPTDPKTAAVMMQMHGEIMKAVGDVMVKYGKILETSPK